MLTKLRLLMGIKLVATFCRPAAESRYTGKAMGIKSDLGNTLPTSSLEDISAARKSGLGCCEL